MHHTVNFAVGRLGFLCLFAAVASGCAGDEGSSRTGSDSDAGAPGGGSPGASGGASGASAGGVTSGAGAASGGSAGVLVDKCASPTPVSEATLLDFEDGTGDGSMGFYVYADSGTDGGAVTPASNDVIADGVVDGGAHGSAHAFSFTGSAFGAASYGAGLGVWMSCRDASSVEGVRFYVKSDVDLMVTASNPVDDPTSNGGECVGDFSSCVQNGKLVPAAASWTLVELGWNDFSGGKPVSSVDPGEIGGFGIAIQKPTDVVDGWGFSLSIDEFEWLGAPADGDGSAGAPGTSGSAAGGHGGA